MSDGLKPCPFCGCEAKIEIDEDGSAFITVEHEDYCYLDGVDTTQWFYARNGKSPAQVAAEVWNRRAERTCRDLNPPSCRDFECSECGESSEFTPGFMPNYCPNCGARVVEEASDDADR